MRIVAGTLRGRRLVAPPGEATRPTADRAKEALFSILGDLAGVRVADLYAGTGALGLEALSRGAANAVFVESARPALAALRSNVASLDVAPRARVLATTVEKAARDDVGELDLVLADPPWALVRDGSAPRAIAAFAARHLAPHGTLALEHARADAPPELAGLDLVDARSWGDTAVSFYARVGEPPASAS